MAITEEKGLGRKSLERKFRTGKRDMRKESGNKNNKKLSSFFFFFLALQHIIEKLQRNTTVGTLPEELNLNQKKGSFVISAAFPRVSFELVITEYLAVNLMFLEKE